MKIAQGLLLLVSALFPTNSIAKLQTGSITLGGDLDDFKWKYLSKFGYTVGSGTWAVRFKTLRPYVNKEASITADVFLDLEWDKVESEPNVCERHKFRRASGAVNLPSSGDWSDWINGTLSQTARAYVWYVAANDCKNQLGSPTRIKFEYIALQENGDHFSVEMLGCYWIALLELLFFSVLSRRVYNDCKRYIKTSEKLHPVMITVVSMMALHFSAVLCQFLHFRSYSYDGQGLKALDVIAEILNVLSQVIGTSLLILIGLGYTLLHSKLGNLDVGIYHWCPARPLGGLWKNQGRCEL